MTKVLLQSSALNPGVSPVEIYCRDEGKGPALFLLHGGWGYSFNPFNRQLEKLRDQFRVICPDRSGYGGSSSLAHAFTTDFHYRAAEETIGVMDALGIERASFWGHSDGAVIAAILGFTRPDRVDSLVLEAFHYFRLKPSSREFFETLMTEPELLGVELCGRFALEFSAANWRRMITDHAAVWREIALRSAKPDDDLYSGQLKKIRAPVLLLHGRLDPRTEPGELEAVAKELPHAELQLIEGAAHCPHSEANFADVATELARQFLTKNVRLIPSAVADR
ncbi:MAG TPA: alpha/beta hydrolase [Pyrinomonadaceae bacterium]|nr:alpha/beta hydrolase [Pyrinomonadaceae bacterium]